MIPEKYRHVKDIKRFSFSRFRTFHTCPRKHHYTYVEQVEAPDSEFTIPGKLFHQALEYYLTQKDMEPVFKEFEELTRDGTLDLPADLLEYIVNEYLRYYSFDFTQETPLLVEAEFNEKLEGDDYMSVKVDYVFRRSTSLAVHLRDYKTTQRPLKYDDPGVRTNQQLLLYTPYVEEALQEPVQVIEIDEIRLCKLDPVPMTTKGIPSTDKKRLELVTYEDYYEKLCQLDLEDSREYDYILEYLKETWRTCTALTKPSRSLHLPTVSVAHSVCSANTQTYATWISTPRQSGTETSSKQELC
jgi:CRISPR/Cas system-associated exonuclease Cas4 (RecB family)